MKVLVIFDLIPEETKRCIVDMTNDEYDYFSQAHNYITNGDDWDDIKVQVVNVINNAFGSGNSSEYCETRKEFDYFGKWKADDSITDISDVDKMICCGFYL